MKRPDLFTEMDTLFSAFKNKKVTVAHSAGLNSNALILALHCAGAVVDSAHIECEALPSSMVEKKIIAMFIDRLNASTDKWPVTPLSISFTGAFLGASRYLSEHVGISLNILPLLSDTESVACFVGLVGGNKSIAYIPNIQKAWKANHVILKNEKKLPELLFPFHKYTKTDLVNYMRYLVRRYQLDHSLPLLNWSCHNGSTFPFYCGECEGCKQSHMDNVTNQGIMQNLDRVFRNYMSVAEFLSIEEPEYLLTWSNDNDKKHPQLILRNSKGSHNGSVLMTIPRVGGHISEKPLENGDVPSDQQWLYLPVGHVPHKEVFKDAWGVINVSKKIN